MEFKLFTFAYDNNGIWKNAELVQQIAKLYYINNGFTEDEIIDFKNEDIQDLIKECPQHFYNSDYQFLYGYFIWRFYLLLKLIYKQNDNDIVISSDIGSLVSGDIKNFLNNFLKEEEFFFFREDIPMYKDCKRDLFIQIPVNYEKYCNLPLIRGCFWAVKKTGRTIFYLENIYENMKKIENVDQIIRIMNNPKNFVVNHSEQAVATLTLINLGFDIIKYEKKRLLFLEKYKDIQLLIHVCRSPDKIIFEDICEKLKFSDEIKEKFHNILKKYNKIG